MMLRSPRLRPKSLGVWRAQALAVSASAILAGCGEDPSFEVRWAIASDFTTLASPIDPESVAECTAFGLGGVRVTTKSGGLLIDEREFQCFEGGAVSGPTLDDGIYDIEVVGLRRNGNPWTCTLEVDTPVLMADDCETGSEGCGCLPEAFCNEGLNCAAQILPFNSDGTRDPADPICLPCTAREKQRVEIDGSRPELQYTLIAPPECDDGIDNDEDGLTDVLDPACASDATKAEDSDLQDTIISVSASFLDNNPLADCDSTANIKFPLLVGTLQFEVHGPEGLLHSEVFECQRNLPLRTFPLPAGDYEIRLLGFTLPPFVPFPNKIPLPPLDFTVVKTLPFVVTASAGGFVNERIDFRGEDFLTPLQGRVGASFIFDADGDPATSAAGRLCTDASVKSGSPLDIEELRIRVLDRDGVAVDPATLAIPGGSVDGDATRTSCDNLNLEFSTAVLDWNSYTLEVEGLVGGEVCYDQGPATMWTLPDEAKTETLFRVLVAGEPPAGCEDCSVDADCPSTSAPRCEASLCRSL